MSAPTLHTIGYKGYDIDGYLDVLRHAGIGRLIDVRRSARSRKRDFNKNRLRSHCEDHGIEYVHLPRLGAPKAARDAYLDDGDWDTFRDAFHAYLESDEAKEGLAELRHLASERPSAITCLCADPDRCHRGLIAERSQTNFEIRHLPGPEARAGT